MTKIRRIAYRSDHPDCPRTRRHMVELRTTSVFINRDGKSIWKWTPPTYHYGATANIAEKRADLALAEAEERNRKSLAAEAARRAGRKRQNLERLVRADMAAHGEDEADHG